VRQKTEDDAAIKTTERILGLINDSKTNMREREEQTKKNSSRDMFIFIVLMALWVFAIVYNHLLKN
jgi:hypothetical protein